MPARLAQVIDLRAARQEPDRYRSALARRGAADDFDAVLAADQTWRELTERELDDLRRAVALKAPRGQLVAEIVERRKQVARRRRQGRQTSLSGKAGRNSQTAK